MPHPDPGLTPTCLTDWLFAAATTDATVFAIAAGRGTADAETLLSADVDGFLVRDGAAIYRAFATPYQQTCNNHLIHRCTRLLEQASAARARPPNMHWLDLGGEVTHVAAPNSSCADHGATARRPSRDRFAAEEGVSARDAPPEAAPRDVRQGHARGTLARLLDTPARAGRTRMAAVM